jgi:hypothetical protein
VEGLREWQGIVALAFSTLLGLAAWAFRGRVQEMIADRASAAEVKHVAKLAAEIDRRVIHVEQRLEALPTAEQFAALSISIEAVRGDLKAVAAEQRGTNELIRAQQRKVELIDEYLRRRDG